MHAEVDGLIPIGDQTPKDNRTIIVVGTGRGGTSLISGILHHLGIFTGSGSTPPIYEDTDLSFAFESDQESDVSRLIRTYNDKKAIWAFKRPSYINYLEKYHNYFRNPYYIFIFRDPVATTQSKLEKGVDSFTESFNQSIDFYKISHKLIEHDKYCGLLISYEKAIRNLNSIIPYLFRTLLNTGEIEPQSAKSIVQNLKSDHYRYKNLNFNNLYMGHLDQANDQIISGWAAKRSSMDPITVTIKVNGTTIATVLAQRKRNDVLLSGLHGNSECGFELTTPVSILKGDCIEAYFENSEFEITNSPILMF